MLREYCKKIKSALFHAKRLSLATNLVKKIIFYIPKSHRKNFPNHNFLSSNERGLIYLALCKVLH